MWIYVDIYKSTCPCWFCCDVKTKIQHVKNISTFNVMKLTPFHNGTWGFTQNQAIMFKLMFKSNYHTRHQGCDSNKLQIRISCFCKIFCTSSWFFIILLKPWSTKSILKPTGSRCGKVSVSRGVQTNFQNIRMEYWRKQGVTVPWRPKNRASL